MVTLEPWSSLSDTDLTGFGIGAEMVLQQVNGANAGVAIASVVFDQNGANPTITWAIQRGALGGSIPIKTDAINLAQGLGQPYHSMIVSEVVYDWKSAIQVYFKLPIHMTAKAIGEPSVATPDNGYFDGLPYFPDGAPFGSGPPVGCVYQCAVAAASAAASPAPPSPGGLSVTGDPVTPPAPVADPTEPNPTPPGCSTIIAGSGGFSPAYCPAGTPSTITCNQSSGQQCLSGS